MAEEIKYGGYKDLALDGKLAEEADKACAGLQYYNGEMLSELNRSDGFAALQPWERELVLAWCDTYVGVTGRAGGKGRVWCSSYGLKHSCENELNAWTKDAPEDRRMNYVTNLQLKAACYILGIPFKKLGDWNPVFKVQMERRSPYGQYSTVSGLVPKPIEQRKVITVSMGDWRNGSAEDS